jgi:oligopeptidase A
LASVETNPLHLFGTLPRFDLIVPGHVESGIRDLIESLSGELDELEATLEPTWAGLIEPLESIGERVGYAWGLVGHLMGVKNSDALRDAHASVQSELVAFGLRQAQSRPLFEGLEALRAGPNFSSLELPQRRIVENLLREARHSGVGLAETERARFNEIAAELAELGTKFSNHVLDATNAFSLSLTSPDEIVGIPESIKALTAQAARSHGEKSATAAEGPWRITLDAPVLIPFLEHGEHRGQREELYRAYVTRASSGEFDNTKVIERILALRHELAGLLDFENYAALSIDSKMAPGLSDVQGLLEDLRSASLSGAHADLDALRAFASGSTEKDGKRQPLDELKLWDVAFYAERLREARFDYSEEALRPYFPLPEVLDGLFSLARRLFGISIVPADGETAVWHPDVRFFRVLGEKDEPIAAFFLDPYSRSGEKRGGAWMDECLGRNGRTSALPVAYLVCNQTPPIDDKPSLMSFDELLTLFHEFGHGLQHMLTRVDYALASGIRNIEWDAVELPSQFMENWCYHKETLLGLSKHFETGETLPVELFDKITAARTYRAASQMLRQLYFSSMDLALHAEDLEKAGEDIFSVQRRIAETTTVMPPLPEDRFLCSFGHIFAGGYAAGYYSYKWAEVLSADAFSAFEEAGLEDASAVAETGRRFRDTVLSLGGGTPPMEVFKAFRGREPSPAALLRHSGLASEAG